MPQPDDRQFDPVANAALGAIRSTNRTVREVQRRSGMPELPAQTSAYRGARDIVKNASSLSPFNVFGRGGIPEPDDLVNANGALPDMSFLPDPNQITGRLPGFNGDELPTPPSNGNGGNGNGGNGNGGNGNGGNGNGGNGSAPTATTAAGSRRGSRNGRSRNRRTRR